MASSRITMRVQELGGSWQMIGTEKSRGIWIDPASFSMDADEWGSRQLQAVLRLDPGVLQPHISAFTPIEIEDCGVLCWTGRVKETPSTDGDDKSITINGEGWQYHTDDDAYQRVYVHSALTDFVDVRGLLTAELGQGSGLHPASCQVNADQSGITLMFPANVPIGQFEGCSVQLDLGPDTTAARIVIDVVTSNNDGNVSLFCFVGNDDRPQRGTSVNPITQPIAVASATLAGTPGTPGRYVSFRLQRQGIAYTPGVDIWAKITRILVFADTTYESGNVSVLGGWKIAQDAIQRATLLLSSDFSQVSQTPFAIPDFAMPSPQTPRDVITAALAFDDYIPRITCERQLSIRARPTLATYEVGKWAGAQFEDASTNSGDQIYSSVSVSGTGPDGSPVKVQRTQPPALFATSAIQPTNPSAAVNTTGWAALYGGTLTRDTVTFDTSPGAFKIAAAGVGQTGMQMTAWSGTFVPGGAYRLTFRYSIAFPTGPLILTVFDANGTVIGAGTFAGTGAFATATIDFSPQTSGAPTVRFESPFATNLWVDSLVLSQGSATLVDRRGFRRTFVLDSGFSLTAAGAAAIGDVFLANHKTTPFKGTLTLNGTGSIRKVKGGVGVTMGELLRNTGELILFSHLTDPDTGGLGRYGRIASVSVSGPWSATVQIDSTNDNFQNLLNRIQINTGQVR